VVAELVGLNGTVTVTVSTTVVVVVQELEALVEGIEVTTSAFPPTLRATEGKGKGKGSRAGCPSRSSCAL
jgi:hypothetical protein